jgi:hypothetical protein
MNYHLSLAVIWSYVPTYQVLYVVIVMFHVIDFAVTNI